jgi:predicted metal-dependent hydrolase
MNLKRPLLIAFVADLYFSPRIESATERIGYQVRLIEVASQIAPFDPKTPDEPLGEHLAGQTGMLIEKVTTWQPALMIFDLNNADVPWEDWIPVLKSSPATRRITIMAFGSHMDVETMTRAKEVGADVVLARSAFVNDLPNLIRKHARIPDRDAIAEACKGELSELALEGIRLFNEGEYFEAHEELELAWNEDQSAARELYRAILQVAVAYLQIERGNYRGAVKMFLRMRQWLDPLPDICRGVDVEKLRLDARKVEERLIALGEADMRKLDRGLFKPVRMI